MMVDGRGPETLSSHETCTKQTICYFLFRVLFFLFLAQRDLLCPFTLCRLLDEADGEIPRFAPFIERRDIL